MSHSDDIETCAARMIILWRLKDSGYLEGKTLQEIANWFDVHRSTILRDLRKVANAERRLPQIQAMVKSPPLKQWRQRYKSSQPRH